MSIDVELKGVDTHGHISKVNVTPLGQLVTAPFAYDEVMSDTLTSTGTAYNFFLPKTKARFVLTVALIAADRNIGASGSLVEIYEASTADTTTVDKAIMSVDLIKNTSRDVVGLNLLITQGKYINVKCDDSNIAVTLMGYYVPVFQGEG